MKVLSRTGVLGLGDDLGKELGEVGEVLAEEGGLEDEGLAGVVGLQLAAEELGLADDTEGGSLVGVLYSCPSCQLLAHGPLLSLIVSPLSCRNLP